MSSTDRAASPSILDKFDEVVNTPLEQFDAFPKLPSTYKARSESRGFVTLFVAFLAFVLVLNDLGEYIWGWPDYEFSVDAESKNGMNVNVDLVVNMPCQYLRDAVGDRLYLSDGFRRDGTLFDIGQATALQEHAAALSVRQAVAQSRRSRGFFATLFRRVNDGYRPTYNYQPDGSACRVYGTIEVKKVTAFVAYQYFLHVVPTTYIAPRSKPVHTHQYSVTHYTRVLEHNRGVPGIFFKFDLEPLSITIHQRTTTFLQLMIRCVGVIGGVFVCMGYAVKITSHAVDVVSGADKTQGIVAAEATGVGAGLRKKWGGGELRSRGPRHPGYVAEGGSPYSSYANTPMSGNFSHPPSPYAPSPYSAHTSSPYLASAGAMLSPNPSAGPGSGFGLGLTGTGTSPRLTPSGLGSGFPTAATSGSPYPPPSPLPSSGLYSHFPQTPNTANGFATSFPRSPAPGSSMFSSQQATLAPPPRRHPEGGASPTKKSD